MRIRRIHIRNWRHFSNIELSLREDAKLVCIVGANGTGKSHLLELIATSAHRLGLSNGVDIPRGDPFNDAHNIVVVFYLAEGVSDVIDTGLTNEGTYAEWDRTLTITSVRDGNVHHTEIRAGGVTDPAAQINFANTVIDLLRASQDVHFLSLDADRAYPDRALNSNQMAEAYETNWEGVDYTRGRSYRTTTTLYDEWKKYFLGTENQSATQHAKGIRRARNAGAPEPRFEDNFEPYKQALQKVLPHIIFTGTDPKKRTLVFDTTGRELVFNQLSGGEREIAFLIGQIDRFGLRDGLFLLDEPELHLNSDLIRSWVSYLTGTVTNGQIWLATHSLEAVEAAGQQSTFVLERDDATRSVNSIARLDTRPVLSALSRAVGTPAFSITQLQFVFVEGEEGVGERERFRKLAGSHGDVRFMECGSCKEVERRVAAIKALADEAGTDIRIGGVVDRDFRRDAAEMMADNGILVLPVHEVENLFLHPPTLAALLAQNGRDGVLPADLIRNAADQRAGSWIFQYAMATDQAADLHPIPAALKDRAKSYSWVQIEADQNAALQTLSGLSGFDENRARRLTSVLEAAISVYRRKRTDAALWKECEGKQVLVALTTAVGFADFVTFTDAAFALWIRQPELVSEELTTYRNYISSR